MAQLYTFMGFEILLILIYFFYYFTFSLCAIFSVHNKISCAELCSDLWYTVINVYVCIKVHRTNICLTVRTIPVLELIIYFKLFYNFFENTPFHKNIFTSGTRSQPIPAERSRWSHEKTYTLADNFDSEPFWDSLERIWNVWLRSNEKYVTFARTSLWKVEFVFWTTLLR